MTHDPKTLQQAIRYFTDPDNCMNYLVARRWPDGVVCPTCGSKDVSFVPSRRVWQCKTRHSKCQFSVKVGTIFEDSPIPLDKWLCAMWMLANCKNGVSSWEIHRALGITQKSAWFVLHRIRLALQAGGHTIKLGGNGGEVEVDETFIGGKARNMHLSRRRRRLAATGVGGKAPVLGILERDGEVRVSVIPNIRKKQLQDKIKANVESGAPVYTDALLSYYGLSTDYEHKVIDHANRYAEGRVHTNGMENFWSLLKRGLNGTYVSVEPFHLFRYLDEQAWRFNNRATENNPVNDADRFSLAVSQIIGKRLTYAELTGKPATTPAEPF
jgi:transposase-like protein